MGCGLTVTLTESDLRADVSYRRRMKHSWTPRWGSPLLNWKRARCLPQPGAQRLVPRHPRACGVCAVRMRTRYRPGKTTSPPIRPFETRLLGHGKVVVAVLKMELWAGDVLA